MYQSTGKVLILEYMDGIRLNDNDSLEAYGVDKQKLVEEITRHMLIKYTLMASLTATLILVFRIYSF